MSYSKRNGEMVVKNKLRLLMYYLGVRLKRGVTVSIIITNRCNLTCEYCIVKGMIKHPDMTFDFMRDIIRKFPVKIKEVYITGGEPTLNRELETMVNWLTSEGIYVALFTNLTRSQIFNRSLRLRIKGAYYSSQTSGINVSKRYKFYAEERDHGITINEVGEKTLEQKMNKDEKLTKNGFITRWMKNDRDVTNLLGAELCGLIQKAWDLNWDSRPVTDFESDLDSLINSAIEAEKEKLLKLLIKCDGVSPNKCGQYEISEVFSDLGKRIEMQLADGRTIFSLDSKQTEKVRSRLKAIKSAGGSDESNEG